MRASFVLAATAHGPLIVNRHDRVVSADGMSGYGVGLQLLEHGIYDPAECASTIKMLSLLRAHRGEGVVAVDVGANIGAFTVTWARYMLDGGPDSGPWGEVHAFEPQKLVFYALCGNIVLNNLTNVHAYYEVVGHTFGYQKDVPRLNFDAPGSYGSLSLLEGKSDDVGQELNDVFDRVWMDTIDHHFTERVDIIKIDVEGMEMDVLNGATATIERCKPVLIVEHLKSDKEELGNHLKLNGYAVFEDHNNFLAIHHEDPCLNHVKES